MAGGLLGCHDQGGGEEEHWHLGVVVSNDADILQHLRQPRHHPQEEISKPHVSLVLRSNMARTCPTSQASVG